MGGNWDISQLQKDIHQNAKEKGFWEDGAKPELIPEKLCLMHSEISEALEAYRENPHGSDIIFRKDGINYPLSVCKRGTYGTGHFLDGTHKPEGLGVELADCVIRILDFCQAYDIDLAEAIEIKMKYNATRPYKHGKVC